MGNQQSGAGGGAGKVRLTDWLETQNFFIGTYLIVKLPQDKGENKEKKKYEPPVPTRCEIYDMRTESESSDQGWQEEEEGQGTRRCQQAAWRHPAH